LQQPEDHLNFEEQAKGSVARKLTGNRRRIGSCRSPSQKNPTSTAAKVQLRHRYMLPSNRLPVQQTLLLRLQPRCLSSAKPGHKPHSSLKNTFSALPWHLTAGPALTDKSVGQELPTLYPRGAMWLHRKV